MSILSAGDVSISPATSASPALSVETRDGNGKKRKRDEVDETTEVDRRPFAIKDPSNPFACPRTYTPICLLSRAQLPLAYLDTAQPGGRLFSACIPILERVQDDDDGTAVLVAEEKEKRLYAIERVKARTYALCRLQQAVTEEDILARAKCIVRIEEPQRKRHAVQTVEKGAPWWTRAAVEMPQVGKRGADQPLLPTLMMQRVTEAPQKVAINVSESIAEQQSPTRATDRGDHDPLEMAETQKTPDEVIQDLAKHYLEALYISRTSLAFFTKGPLSRARAAFSRAMDATLVHLVESLRQSVLTSTTLDKKYRESVNELVKALPPANLESPEDVAKRKKKKKKWKSRRSKAGFFVDEEDYIERWWRVEETLGSPETTDAALRRRMPGIRIRETFLQLILILEILAVEATDGYEDAMARPNTAEDGETQATESQLTESPAPSAAQKTKSKKKQDLPALLETLLDKLCIWNSLEAHSPAKLRTSGLPDETTDMLKNFCVDVVVPFYVSRTPKYATLVNKKLGGPSPPSPARDKSATRKPGEPASRQPPAEKTRGPLKRVSTEIHNRRDKQPLGFHRSATDSETLIKVKREHSESPSIGSIPQAGALSKPLQPRRKTSDLLQELNARQRSVDIAAMSKASEDKSRRQALKKETLEKMKADAISVMRKPNRALTAKQVADGTEERVRMTEKKGSKPQQRAKKAEAEVAGVGESGARRFATTPSRFGPRVMGVTPHQRRTNTTTAVREAPTSATSSDSMVPSSSARLRALPPLQDAAVSEPIFAIPQTGHRPRHFNAFIGNGVEQTPSRGFAKFMPRGLATQPGTGTLESPIARRTAAPVVEGTPMKAAVAFKMLEATPVRARLGLAETPLQATGGNGVVDSGLSRGGESSIYASLGWDDDGYEELA
jgi:hypothetical protein